MKKYILFFFFIITLLFFNKNLYAEVWETGYSWYQRPVDGIFNVTHTFLADLFTPSSFYNKGDTYVIVSYSSFDIDVLFDKGDGLVKYLGKDLNGKAYGIVLQQAVTDRFLLYISYVETEISGDSIYRLYDAGMESTLTIDNEMRNLEFGIAYDLIGNSNNISIPWYLGGIIYDFDAEMHERNVQPWRETDIYGGETLFGLTTCMAISFKFLKYFRLTPFMSMKYMQEPNITGVDNTTGATFGGKAGQNFYLIPGLDLNVNFGKNFQYMISISLGSYIRDLDFYKDGVMDGLDIDNKGSFTFSYKF